MSKLMKVVLITSVLFSLSACQADDSGRPLDINKDALYCVSNNLSYYFKEGSYEIVNGRTTTLVVSKKGHEAAPIDTCQLLYKQ